MDDDPEPTFDQVILESCEAREQLLSFGEQKCAAEIGEENAMESGDIGPAVDADSPKRPVAVKDAPDRTESKASILRRKERRDQGQQADLPGSVKSSATCLRKPSRRSSQRLVDQESRRNSQQPASQLPLLSQKPSRGQAVNEANVKDPTWVSQRTGKVMKSRSQQTSLIWERKALSEILHPSSNESAPSRDEEAEFALGEEDITSFGEAANERYPGHESRHGSKQLEGKLSKHSSSQQQLERFGSRRSSQRCSEPPSTLGPKYSRSHPTKGTDTDKDITWISQRTGREMTCKAQQTSLIWGSGTLPGFHCSSGQDSQTGSDNESGLSVADEVASSGETGREEPTARESYHRSQQREGSASKPSSRQQLGRSEDRRSSQKTLEQPYLLNLKPSREEFTKERAPEEELVWISQRTGKEMTCKSQQTSLVWDYKTLPDILDVYGPTSEVSGFGEDDTTEDEEGEAQMDQGAVKEAQHLEAEETRQDLRQAEEQKPEPRRKKRKSKTDQSQQTDSVESIKKELADSSQQTDATESMETSVVDLSRDPGRGAEQADVEGSRQSSQELVGQDSRCSSSQPECRDSQRGSQQSLRPEAKTAEEDEAKVPANVESEPPGLLQKDSFVRGTEETSWVSHKTGRLVRNQSQQTDRSWLQYFALKSQKLKRCISQQTDESFLQRYRKNQLKEAVREHRKSHTQDNTNRCALCGDLYGEDFLFDMDTLSSFSTMSILSTISSQETAEAESAEEQERLTSTGDDEHAEVQPPPQQGSERDSQPASGQESPKGAGQESRRGSLQAADGKILVRWTDEFESNTASESSLLYTEGEDKIQQTYSMISFEDGIWMNRKTGKLLVSHSQQTSESLVPTVSGTALEESGSAAEGGLVPTEMDDSGVVVDQDFQQDMEADGQQPPGQESRRGSQQEQNSKSHLAPEWPTEEGLRSADEVEKLVCSRLSEATLLSIESPDVEDGPVQVYTVVSLEKGSWMNVKTGKYLASQSQQTEASFPPNSAEDEAATKVPSQKSPEEGQVDIPQPEEALGYERQP